MNKIFFIPAFLIVLTTFAGCKLGRDYPPEAFSRPFVTTSTLPEKNISVPGVRRISKVSDTLFRGDQPTAEGFQQLKEMGIKTVVNTRLLHGDQDKMAGTGLQYKHIVFPVWYPNDKGVVDFLRIANNPENQPVFVHCRLGNDRTGMMIAVYRVMFQGWTLGDAMREMKHYGYNPSWRWMENYLKSMDVEELRRKYEQAEEPELEVIQ